MALAAQADRGVEIRRTLGLVPVPTDDRRGFAILEGPSTRRLLASPRFRGRRAASPGGNER